ncbi:MAG: imidazole glycerol phosphate synthase subunit HisH [Chloroflexi bacterium]|nr:imidazole glycerol phosphate synthase subunit HisH [Chloroflexota bacterium]
MIAIIDYKLSNLRSVQRAFAQIGVEAQLLTTPDDLAHARGAVIPGVGAFGQAMSNLREAGFVDPIHEFVASGRPFGGICLGMQLLFDESEELGQYAGLSLLPGQVKRFSGGVKVPHIGWNQVQVVRDTPLLADVPSGSYAYFVHSYYCVPARAADTCATTEYDGDFASVVARDNIYGFQFHPEKSQQVGLQMLRNFARLAGESV